MACVRGVTPLFEWARKNARIRNPYVIEGMAEFLATAVLCFFAVGSAAQMHLFGSDQPFLMAVFGGVFGLMTAIYIFGGLTGAQVNPAVSFGMAIAGELSWLKVPVYWVAQISGGYLGSLIAYGLYEDTFKSKMGLTTEVSLPDVAPHLAGIFSPIKPGISLGVGIADQFVCVTILLMGVFSLVDKRNMGVPKHMLAFFVCLIVATMAFCFDINAGAVLNPARDLAPRLAALTLGFKYEVVMQNVYRGETQEWWLVGIIGPMLGATFGTLLYIFTVGAHLADTPEEAAEKIRQFGNNNSDQTDWRSTQFIPKPKLPSAHPGNGTPQPNNNNYYVGQPPGQGQPNPGYMRGPEDVRYRQGYQ